MNYDKYINTNATNVSKWSSIKCVCVCCVTVSDHYYSRCPQF